MFWLRFNSLNESININQPVLVKAGGIAADRFTENIRIGGGD